MLLMFIVIVPSIAKFRFKCSLVRRVPVRVARLLCSLGVKSAEALLGYLGYIGYKG